MTISADELNPEDLEVLTELAEESGKEGKDLSIALREAVNAYLERSAKKSEPNGARDSEAEREQAFLRAAGAWSDMDTDTLIDDIYEQRLRQTRPEPKW
jgi:predicted DNA-binding ribbon-helix-helix protein